MVTFSVRAAPGSVATAEMSKIYKAQSSIGYKSTRIDFIANVRNFHIGPEE